MSKINKNSSSLSIQPQASKPLSDLQKRFNKRVEEVEKMKVKVTKAKEQLELVKSLLASEVMPMEKSCFSKEVEVMKRLDYWCENAKGFKKSEIEQMTEWILRESDKLIAQGAEELIPIYDKYNDITYAEEQEFEANALKDMIRRESKEQFGVEFDLEDVDFNSPEELIRAIMGQLEEKEGDIRDFHEKQADQHRAKKTEVQQKREEEREAELKDINKTVKAIYTSLAKRYHPDRAEDEEDQKYRTGVMQQVTEAYENNDLFELLRLKFEMVSDKEELSELPDDQLSHYNSVLNDQLRGLRRELRNIKNPPPPFEYYADYMSCRTVNGVKKKMKLVQRELSLDMEAFDQILTMLREKKTTKELLSDVDMELSFQQDFLDFFGETNTRHSRGGEDPWGWGR